MTPTDAGSHTLVLRFSVPPTLINSPLAINGDTLSRPISNEIERQFEVYTVLGLPISWSLLFNKLAYGMAFVLALPSFKLLAERLLANKRRSQPNSPVKRRRKIPPPAQKL
jgi:hypothetical protein